MKRVVVTGIGIVSCLGNDKESVLDSLKAGRSGIQHNPTYEEIGMRSHVSGSVQIDTAELIDRKILRFMGDASAYAYLAMEQAISDANLTQEEVSNFRSGLVVGSGGGSSEEQLESTDIMREKGLRRGRTLPCNTHHEQHHVRLSGHSIQNQRRQLHDLISLRDQRTLHWPWSRANSARQAGYRFRRRRRGRTLDNEPYVRCYGRAFN